MTDPQRISNRSRGLAAELLRAGADEQPSDASIERTLLALGVSGAVLTTTTAAGATAAGGAQAAGIASAGAASGAGVLGAGAAAGGTAKVATLTLLAKWVSIGVVGGVGLAGAAAVATSPRATEPPSRASVATPTRPLDVAPPPLASAPVQDVPAPPPAEAAPAAPAVVTPVAPAHPVPEPVAPSPAVELDVGTPLAAEVAYVDRARALVSSGQSAQGLALLGGYEREFPEARLLPEVLFLQLEALDRAGRTSEARAAAQRLVDGFPKSPHASRARKLLTP